MCLRFCDARLCSSTLGCFVLTRDINDEGKGNCVKLESLISLLRPAPFIEVQTDQETIEMRYRYWRRRIFYSIYMGYVVFYFTRKSFTFAMPHMASDLNLSMADLGMLGSLLYITYGFSKFISGMLSDQSNPRFFMSPNEFHSPCS